jgi:glycine/D-amino acid oxidase-like deaminating enzyme
VPQSFDVIVIGLGAMGAAATYQLAKAGARVLGLDRFAPPHDLGSTHGETRITRLACGEGLEYTPFAHRSHDIWRALERETGERLFVQNGLLVISGTGRRAAAHGNPNFLQTTTDAANAHGVPHDILTEAQIRERFPAFAVAAGDEGYFEPEAGFVFPERCVSAQEASAMYADYVAPFFPGVSGACERSAVCLYTCTDDARFVVDVLPEAPRVVVASPCSGHGFKHSAAIGEAIAQLAGGTQPALDLSAFRLQA